MKYCKFPSVSDWGIFVDFWRTCCYVLLINVPFYVHRSPCSDEFGPSTIDVTWVVLVPGCKVDYVVLELDSSWATFGFVVFSEAFGTQYLYPRVADSWTSYCLRDNFPMDIYMKGLRSLFWLALKINQFIKLFVKFKVVSCIIFLCGLSIMVTHEIKHKWVGIWSVLLTWYRISQLLRFGIIMGLNPGQGQVII